LPAQPKNNWFGYGKPIRVYYRNSGMLSKFQTLMKWRNSFRQNA